MAAAFLGAPVRPRVPQGHGSGFAAIPLLAAPVSGAGEPEDTPPTPPFLQKVHSGRGTWIFFRGGEGSGKPWKSPFQKCRKKGEERDKGYLQITCSAASLGTLRCRTAAPSPPGCSGRGARAGRPRRGHRPPGSGAARGLNVPARPGPAAAAEGSPSRCDS